jgi:hypothetical protein
MDVECLKRRAIADIIGINITTTGVLFMNIETENANMKTIDRVRLGELSNSLFIRSIVPSNAPVWNNPCPTTNNAIIVTSAGAANPDNKDVLLKLVEISGLKK